MTKIRKILTKTLTDAMLKYNYISDGEIQQLEESILPLNEEYIDKILLEVNKDLVYRNCSMSLELGELIINAIENNNLNRLSYKIDGFYPIQVLIKNQDKFPRICLTNLQQAGWGAYNYPDNTIYLDLLDNDGNIDHIKKAKFYDFIITVVLSHELNHKDRWDFLKSINKGNFYVKDRSNDTHSPRELEAFKYQLSQMTNLYFDNYMRKEIQLTPDLDLNTIFSSAINRLIIDELKKNALSGSFLTALETNNQIKDRNKIYQYIYSQAKEMYIKYYQIYKYLQYKVTH